MVRIRLRRVGAKKQPSYRLVAAEKESPRDGRFLENLGFYNPRTEPATIQLQEDRIFAWMDNGAQLSDAAEKVLRTAGALDRYERYKQGEDIEVLVAESKEAEEARNISQKTTVAGADAAATAKKGAKTKEEASKKEEVVESAPAEEKNVEAEVEEAEAETGDETEAEVEVAEAVEEAEETEEEAAEAEEETAEAED